MTRKLYISDLLSCRLTTDAKGIKKMRAVLFYGLPTDTSILFHAANIIDEVRELPIGGELFICLIQARYFVRKTSLASLEERLNRYEESKAGLKPDWNHMYYFKRTPQCFILKDIRGIIV